MGGCRDALEGEEPQRRPQRRLDRRLEGVAAAVGGGYCRLQMPLSLALGVRETVAGHRLGARGGGGVPHPPFQCIPRRRGGGGHAQQHRAAPPPPLLLQSDGPVAGPREGPRCPTQAPRCTSRRLPCAPRARALRPVPQCTRASGPAVRRMCTPPPPFTASTFCFVCVGGGGALGLLNASFPRRRKAPSHRWSWLFFHCLLPP